MLSWNYCQDWAKESKDVLSQVSKKNSEGEGKKKITEFFRATNGECNLLSKEEQPLPTSRKKKTLHYCKDIQGAEIYIGLQTPAFI